VLNGKSHLLKPARSFSLPAGFKPSGKALGAEGPIREAVASAHVYVYGTQAASQEQIRERRQIAAQAAEWSTPQLRLLLAHRVAADRDIKDEPANLVLFGTKETNSVLAGLADKLPMELNPGAADYGLVFVAPAGGKYVLVNSGLPWWTGQETANRPGLRFLRAPYAVLLTLPDYIVFKGSLGNVVAEGRFDPNWRVSPEDRAKLEATGAVVVR
jgi:hypothetical protein